MLGAALARLNVLPGDALAPAVHYAEASGVDVEGMTKRGKK